MVAGAVPVAAVGSDPDSLLAAVAELEADGIRRKEAIVEVARLAGVPKRDVYNLVHAGMRPDGIDRPTTTTACTFDVRDEGPLDGHAGRAAARLPRAQQPPGATSRRCCTRRACARWRPTSAATRPAPARGAGATTGCPLLVGDVAALVDRVGEPVHLVGHDWGAAVGWATGRAPARPGAHA